MVRYAGVAGFFRCLRISSSSSSLVRSITALTDRFVPIDGGGAEEAADCSREDVGGVLIEIEPLATSCLTAVTRGGSLISTRSSSSLLPSCLGPGEALCSAMRDHLPSGSTVT